jgi:hypothetical protein
VTRRARSLLACLVLLGGLAAPLRADDAADLLGRLKQALKPGPTAERVATLRAVDRGAATLPFPKRRAAAKRVRDRIDGEQDDAVRAAMVHTLARLGTATGWVPVIRAWFADRDPVTKAAARQALLWGGGDYLEIVERLWKEDESPTWRADLMLLLGDRRRPDAVPLLLQALGGKERRVQSAAAEALEAITDQAFGYDLERWTAWWEEAGPTLLQPREEPPDPDAETVTVTEKPVHRYEEPPPHVTRSLVPEFYGLKLTSKDIIFVLDISGSVGAGGVSRAKRELVDAIEALGSDVWVTALFFDETVHMWKPEMVRATPAHKADLGLFMRGIETGRKTDVFTPLNAGLQILNRRVEQREASGEPLREAVTMIVVSDGKETSRQTPPSFVVDKLDRLDPAKTVVHAVVLGGRGSRLMADLARRGGGHYIHAK